MSIVTIKIVAINKTDIDYRISGESLGAVGLWLEGKPLLIHTFDRVEMTINEELSSGLEGIKFDQERGAGLQTFRWHRKGVKSEE